MAEAAREQGAEIRTGAEVARVTVSRGRANGVELASGEHLSRPGRAVQRRSQAHVPPPVRPGRPAAAVRGAIGAYRCEGASLKLNLALVRAAGAGRPQPRRASEHRGLIQVTLPLGGDGAAAGRARAAASRPSIPHLEVCFPTVHDPSLAPEGRHVVTVGARSQPYRAGRAHGWDDDRATGSPTG